MTPWRLVVAACLLVLGWSLVGAATAQAAKPIRGGQADGRVLRVVYFVPADREAAPRFRPRLQRVLEDIQAFYADEMEANGFGRMTFALDRDGKGALRVHEIHGRDPAARYTRQDTANVAAEVREGLAARGIAMDEETVLIVQRLMHWEDGRAVETGPYAGGGGGGVGTAFVYDDPRLDAALLDSREPGGYCHRPCSWGEFNSLYIGGIAHELGHAFGLAHLAEQAAQRERGRISLMGNGNRTYRADLWGGGQVSFLSLGSAALLPANPLFSGGANVKGEGDFRLSGLSFDRVAEGLAVRGKVSGKTAAVAVVGRNDDQAIANDYDAVGWVATVEDDGRFELLVGDLKPTAYTLALTVVGEDGRVRTSNVDYMVARDGSVDVQGLRLGGLLQEADLAFAARDAKALARVDGAIRRIDGQDGEASARVRHLLALLDPPVPVDPRGLSTRGGEVAVSSLVFTAASTGYGPALRDQVRAEGGRTVRIEVGGEFFPSGLYAHAPALHEVATAGDWRRLRVGYGLQDGHDGSVVFVIRGDGRELFRSAVVGDHRPRWTTVDVSGVDVLRLETEDAGDGRTRDWGVWLTPVLKR